MCVTEKVGDEVNCRDICVNTHVNILGRGRGIVCLCLHACGESRFFNEEQKLGYIRTTVRNSVYSKNGKKV